jgi:CheY-like chemotaxis protein
METIKKILWIDDDIYSQALKPYIDEFEENGFSVFGVANPDDIEDKITLMPDLSCIILDISMPYGTKIKAGEARLGMKTGFVILQRLVNNPLRNNIQKIVFTITDNGDIREYCKQKEIEYLAKRDYLAYTFVEKVKEILSGK